MTAQETASRMHRLSALARLHVGKFALIACLHPADAAPVFRVGLAGRLVAQGTFEQVTEAITSRREAPPNAATPPVVSVLRSDQRQPEQPLLLELWDQTDTGGR